MVRLQTPFMVLSLSAALMLIGLLVILRRWGKPDRFRSRSHFSALIADFGPVALCFVVLIVCTWLVWYAFTLRLAIGGDLSHSILPGFFASLVEDIVFFTSLGIVLFVLQRREFERGRSLEDRLDTLFNAKKLTTEELGDLKRQSRRIGCDFRRNEATIDIRRFDGENKCVQIDVIRHWFVASYFTDDYAEFDWKLKIGPDDIANVSPLLQIFPSQTRTHRLNKKGQQISASQAVELHGSVTLDTPEVYEHPAHLARIEPNTLQEYQSRYRVWQRLWKADGKTRHYWEFEASKHWDICVIKVINSLSQRVRIHMRGKEIKVFDLSSGAEQTEPLELSDLVKGSCIFVEFEILG